MDFWKLHGAGNDFILADNRDLALKDQSEMAKLVCHRHFGIGADGFMLAEPSLLADIKMVYYNSDGSRGSMCGNGIRCFSKFVKDKDMVSADRFTVETDDGVKSIEIDHINTRISMVEVNMGSFSGLRELILDTPEGAVDGIFMHMGVPHMVILQEKLPEKIQDRIPKGDMDAAALLLGPIIEKHPEFKEGTNVNFMALNVKDISGKEPDMLVSTWERGAGKTLACGTGVCASVIAAVKFFGMPKNVKVKVPGGLLFISFLDDGRVLMKGEACLICKGQFLTE